MVDNSAGSGLHCRSNVYALLMQSINGQLINKHCLHTVGINRNRMVRGTVRDTALESFKRDLENMQKAVTRLTVTTPYDGGTEPAALSWLLNFLSAPDRDLSQLNTWQQEETFWEAWRFAWDGGQGPFSDLGQIGARELPYPATAAERTALAAEIQHNARAVLTDYVTTGVGTFPKVEAAFSVMREGNLPLCYRGGTLAASFYWMASSLLARYRHRVKKCEGCSLVMLVGRKDQRFHSQACQIGTFIRKKRAAEKENQSTPVQGRKQTRATTRRKRKGGTHGTKR